MNNTHNESNKIVFLDEAATFAQNSTDGLIEAMRKIEGVPRTEYEVRDDKVFVFEKLVQLVKSSQPLAPQKSTEQIVTAVLPQSFITPAEAVTEWGVIPEPYEAIKCAKDGWMILHSAFDASLPGKYLNKAELNSALEKLLKGSILPGEGRFVYRGQAMTLCAPFDTALLPPRPIIQPMAGPENLGYTALSNMTYEQSFDPVSETLFDDVKERESAWESDSTRAAQYAQNHVAEIWARANTLQLETLNDLTTEVMEGSQEDMDKLRALYPELTMLSDGALYDWFDGYQMEILRINGWSASRDNDFLFYLLGKSSGHEHGRHMALKVGQWIGYALLRGDSLDTAHAFAREATLYDRAIDRLSQRIANAMRFLAVDKMRPGQHARRVTTLADMLRIGRKFNGKSIEVEQRLADFNSGLSR